MKITTEKAVLVYRILNSARLVGEKMSDEAKFAIIRIVKALKPIFVSYDDFLKDVSRRLRPDNFDGIESKLREGKPLNPEEQRIFMGYNSDVERCLREEFDKELELEIKPLDEDMMKGFIASNDFAVSDIMTLYDMIGE